jgi:SAM-dependent methyltransferase
VSDDWRVRLFIRQMRERPLLVGLASALSFPLAGRRVLDVGCGGGQWLADFETWEVRRADLAGIELDRDRLSIVQARLAPTGLGPGAGEADIRGGDATSLPWPDGAFDVVLQATMLSSIVEPGMRAQVAREMARVLAPGGAIVSYDMKVGNPRNPRVRRLGRRELARLFPGFDVRARSVTLLVPLTRRLVPVSWSAAVVLERIRLLDTHLMAVLTRTGSAPGA